MKLIRNWGLLILIVIGSLCAKTTYEYQASIEPITESIFGKMTHSWNDNNPVPLEDLRYLQLPHWGCDQQVHQGELIVHKRVAQAIVAIFEELFAQKYPIEKMLLIDAYQGIDERACADNNSSAFCSRLKSNKTAWSIHSYGLAIDINPLMNPYHRDGVTIPIEGAAFLDRTLGLPGMIDTDDAAYKAFTKRGWQWGGHWKSLVDYQHFDKQIL